MSLKPCYGTGYGNQAEKNRVRAALGGSEEAVGEEGRSGGSGGEVCGGGGGGGQ